MWVRAVSGNGVHVLQTFGNIKCLLLLCMDINFPTGSG